MADSPTLRSASGKDPRASQLRFQLRSQLLSQLNNDRRFWQWCTAIFCMFAVLKGLRAPGLWPLTQAELDYSHGFIKRALQGEVLTLLHIHRFHPLSTYFFLQLALLLSLLAAFTRAARTERRFGTLAPVAVFASSYAITFLTHIVGYTDILLGILALLLLLIPRSTTRFFAALLLVPLALLVHESFLLMFLPVVLFSFVLEALLAPRAASKPLTLAGILALLALSLTLVFSVRANLQPAEIARFKTEIAARVDFELRDDFFNVLSRSLAGSVEEAIDGFHYPDWFVPDLVSLANLLPPTLLLLHFARKLVRIALPNEKRARQLIWGSAAIVILAPLLMFLLGVDGGRWNTDAALMMYLVLLLLCRSLPPAAFTLSSAERNAVVLVLAINMACGMGLFDGESTHPYPFVPAVSEDYR